MKQLILGLILCGASFAQCPVEFVNFNTRGAGFSYYTWSINAKWKNVSNKQIIGEKFHIAYFDSTNDRHTTYQDWDSDQKAKPGDTKTTRWGDSYYSRNYRNGAEIWLVKALFADGSVWEDDGSKQCKIEKH